MNMEGKELRIGNWVMMANGLPNQVSRLHGKSITCSGMSVAQPVEPIPLTPEILDKCGFGKEEIETGNPDEGYYYSLELNNEKYCDLSFISGDKNGFLEVCLFPYEDWFRVRYLHQLQNLYFALTQTELNIVL